MVESFYEIINNVICGKLWNTNNIISSKEIGSLLKGKNDGSISTDGQV